MAHRSVVRAAGRALLVALGLVAVLAAAYLVIVDRPGTGGAGVGVPRSPRPSGETPTPQQTSLRATVNGTFVPIRHADLPMAAAGTLASVEVTEGATVAAGDLIATLNDRAARNDLARAQAETDAAAAELALATAQRDGLGLGASESAIAIADAQVAIAEAALSGRRAALEAAESSLTETRLVAPFAGTIVEVTAAPGERVAEDETVVRLADVSAWRVETARLGEALSVGVAAGDEVDITIATLADLALTGRIAAVRVVRAAEDGTGGGGIQHVLVIEPTGTDPRLRWGLTAIVGLSIRAGVES